MSELCALSGCLKPASSKCSSCKLTFYCSKDHQCAAWKGHKKMCKEIASTRKEEVFMQKKMVGASCADSVEPIIGEINSLIIDSGGCCIPLFHEEYKTKYPHDMKGFEILRNDYAHQNLCMKKRLTDQDGCVLDSFGNVQQILRSRWQCFGLNLIDTIPLLEIGQVWKDHPMLVNPPKMYAFNSFNEGYQKYQTMRNTYSPKMSLQRGSNYVSVGFVDLQQLMEAEIVECSELDVESEPSPVVWRGYEMSEIAVARAMIILEMMECNTPVREILQVWYSSCISKEASLSVRDCCRRLANRETDEKLKKLFQCWSDAAVDKEEAVTRWRQYLNTAQLRGISSFCKEEDRVYYARYLLQGYFLVEESNVSEGNMTWFCLPNEYRNWKKAGENIFFSFNVAAIDYNTDLQTSVESRFTNLLDKMIHNIKENRLNISLTTQYLDGEQPKIFKEIKDSKPAIIDWSNIPDYLKFDEFFSMAKHCSGPETVHTFHLMNWITKVYGCSLVDYVDVEDNYYRLDFHHLGKFTDRHGELREMLKYIKEEFKAMNVVRDLPEFLQLDLNMINALDMAERVFCPEYIDTFVEFMFAGQSVSDLKCEKRPLVVIERSCTTADVSFKFKNV